MSTTRKTIEEMKAALRTYDSAKDSRVQVRVFTPRSTGPPSSSSSPFAEDLLPTKHNADQTLHWEMILEPPDWNLPWTKHRDWRPKRIPCYISDVSIVPRKIRYEFESDLDWEPADRLDMLLALGHTSAEFFVEPGIAHKTYPLTIYPDYEGWSEDEFCVSLDLEDPRVFKVSGKILPERNQVHHTTVEVVVTDWKEADKAAAKTRPLVLMGGGGNTMDADVPSWLVQINIAFFGTDANHQVIGEFNVYFRLAIACDSRILDSSTRRNLLTDEQFKKYELEAKPYEESSDEEDEQEKEKQKEDAEEATSEKESAARLSPKKRPSSTQDEEKEEEEEGVAKGEEEEGSKTGSPKRPKRQ